MGGNNQFCWKIESQVLDCHSFTRSDWWRELVGESVKRATALSVR